MKTLYVCDNRACAKCSNACCGYTSNIEHAKNFKKINGDFWENYEELGYTPQEALNYIYKHRDKHDVCMLRAVLALQNCVNEREK